MIRQLVNTIFPKWIVRRKTLPMMMASKVRWVSSSQNTAIKDFEAYMNTEDFKRSSKDSLLDLISSDDLRVDNELRVLDGLMLWVGFDHANRSCHLTELLHHIRYPYTRSISQPVYLSHISQGHHEIKTLMAKEEAYRKLTYQKKLAHLQESGIKSRQYDEVLVALPRHHKRYTESAMARCELARQSFEYFDPSDSETVHRTDRNPYWQAEGDQFVAVQFLNNGMGVLALDDKDDLWLLDCHGNRSKISRPAGGGEERSGETPHGKNIIQLGDCLYFFHYQPRTMELSKILQYNITTDEWQTIKSPMDRYVCVSIATANGKIYTTSGAEPFLFAYDPQCSEWQTTVEQKPKHLLDSVTLSAIGKCVYILTLEFWPSQTDGRLFCFDTETGKRSVIFRDVVPTTSSRNKQNILAAAMYNLNSCLIIPEVSNVTDSNTNSTLSAISAFHSYDPSLLKRTIFHGFPGRLNHHEFQFSNCWKFCLQNAKITTAA
ncbi:kelch-like protein 20 [Ptychodera flava]|uniref:kelch-like protein 20 n=1 Tax=Ptychodera flava TaxID=63121 RepID=UPI003969CEB4